MIYEPMPVGRICRECGKWKPRHRLKKNKKQPFGVEKHCLDCIYIRNMEWQHENVELMRASRKKWADANPGKTELAIKRWSQTHPENIRAIEARNRKKNPERFRRKTQRRAARIKELAHTFTEEEWNEALRAFDYLCAYCGQKPSSEFKTKILTQDHFIPVTKGGAYTVDNIVPACKTCNSQKWNLDPTLWIVKRFGNAEASRILAAIADYFERVKNSKT